ncbi:MAG: hypothetical protein AB7S71_21315 [Dongiaceae bacterium]
MTRESAIGRAERYFDAGAFRDDLARRVGFRSESRLLCLGCPKVVAAVDETRR